MKKVLIVEDDRIFLNFIKESLASYHQEFQVLTAENGKIAKEILIREDIALLLTDIMMPEVDGLSLLAFVNDRNLSIPCFVMSAFGTPEIKKLIPKDVLQFFSKPFPVNQLGPVISEALAEGVPSGAVSGISVASFLLLVEMEKKTCLFEIELQDGKTGLCYFNKGILFNASFEGLRGEDAALSLLQHEKAKFSFKPLPDQKLGKLIDKDLGTLIREARRESAPVSAVQQLETLSEAPVEELEATLDISYEDMFNTEDLSGPLGEEPEHVLDLEGTYQAARKQIGGRMTVVNLCPSHIIFMIGEPRELVAGDELRLEFTLDDKLRSQVAKEVTVVHTRGRYLRCKFSTSYHYDRLGPYLHFNYLDKREI